MGAKKIYNGDVDVVEAVEDGDSNAESYQLSYLSVDHSLPLPAITPRIIELCKDLFKEWSELDASRFSVETVSGGITNQLLKVTVKEESGTSVSVTVRLYGPNTDYVINRDRELQAIKYLSAAGFGAKLLGVFKNGMVQSFIHARTLEPSDLRKPELAAEIAKQLNKFHKVYIPGSNEPQLWNEILNFYDKASTLQFDDTGKQSIYDTISFQEIHNEILEIKELTSLLNAPIVFAHNDLLSGNLMLNEEEGRLYFIDFEYGSYSYRGFDIGNHFNEYAGYDCDYSCYPSKEEQYHFFRHYLQPEKPDEVSQKDLEALYVESNTFMLASHLYWALWALIQVGQGSYSNVYKARDRETGKIVALKKVRFDTTEPESVKFMAREIMILLKLDHPNIVKLEGLATSRMQFSLYLVFDFMQTDLARVISHPDVRLTEPQVKSYMHQLLSGLRHCHDKGILHRDIKGSNLLIDKNGMLKIADFGLAIFFSPKRHLTNRVVTLWYRAPELLLGATEYGVGIDLWSAGCLFAEMFTGRPILPGRTEVEQLHKIFKLCGTPSEEYWRKLKLPPTFRPPQSYRPSLRESFKHFPSSSLGLLNTLLALEPSYRGSASSALDNEFFYTSPLACSLSDLPIIHSEPDVPDKTNQQKSRTAKVTRRSHTHRERRRKDLTAGIPKEESNLPKQLSQQRGDDDEQNEERGSTTTSTSSSVNNGVRKGSTMSSTSSSVNTGGRKTTSTSSSVNTGGGTGSSHFLLSPISYSNRKSSRIQGHLQVTNNLNLPPLPKTREYSSFNIKDHHGAHITGQVRRSVSTRDFRNLERKEHLKLYAVDD